MIPPHQRSRATVKATRRPPAVLGESEDRLTRALIAVASWYCRNSPFPRGKTRLKNLFSERILRGKSVLVESEYHTRFLLRFPEDQGWQDLLFHKSFETGTTDCLLRILRQDDVVFDIGANIGWYSFLAARFLTSGECHSFEPNPSLFSRLEEAVAINEVHGRLFLNQIAIGDRNGRAQLHTFRGLHHGLTSLSTLGRGDSDATGVQIETLDTYIERRGIRRVDIVKVDVEGAELLVLRGARKLFRFKPPPVFVIEMNMQTAAAFGFHPRELLDLLAREAAYDFFRVCGAWGEVLPMKATSEFSHGDNVIAVPREARDLRQCVVEERPAGCGTCG